MRRCGEGFSWPPAGSWSFSSLLVSDSELGSDVKYYFAIIIFMDAVHLALLYILVFIIILTQTRHFT